MRPHPRRASTNPSSPRAWGTDDRSGFVGNHENLCWQFDWAGTGLVNKRILVYPDELDVPQRQLGTIILPPDPAPVMNARPESYAIDEVWPMMMEVSTSPKDLIPVYLETSTIAGDFGSSSISLSLEVSTEP